MRGIKSGALAVVCAAITVCAVAGCGGSSSSAPQSQQASPQQQEQHSYPATSGTLGGQAQIQVDGNQVVAGYIAKSGTLTFSDVAVPAAGNYKVTIDYYNGDQAARQATITVNNGTTQTRLVSAYRFLLGWHRRHRDCGDAARCRNQHDRVLQPNRLCARHRRDHSCGQSGLGQDGKARKASPP